MNRVILVLCDPDHLYSNGLVEKAEKLAEQMKARVEVLVFAHSCAEKCSDHFVQKVYVFKNNGDAIRDIDDLTISQELLKLIKNISPEMIIAGTTVRSRTIMAILAAKLNTGLTADCTDVYIDEKREIIQVRPAYGNSLYAKIVTLESPKMCTYSVAEKEKTEKLSKESHLEIEVIETKLQSKIKNCGFERFEVKNLLSEAEIVFAGGKGIGSKDGFRLLEQLAQKYHGAVAASRAAVNAGYAPYSWQVGQTGCVIRPRVYLAFGISGAIQHIAGMNLSAVIIAVNTDPKAPIFNYADYGVVDSWENVAESLL